MATTTELFDVPNLDCLSVEPSDYATAETVFRILADYCALKRAAMESRLCGNVNDALRSERTMEHVYNRLPQWAKW